jgi:Holliday junction resolvase RusA-like endonuclease
MGFSREDIEKMVKRVEVLYAGGKDRSELVGVKSLSHTSEQVIKSIPVIHLHIEPFAAPRQSRRDAWKPSPRVVRYRNWKDRFRVMCEQYQWSPEPVLKVTFMVEMPRSWSKRKRAEMLHKPHQQKPDIDNICKSVLDAHGVDDGHVWKLRAAKIWGETGAIIIHR